MRHSSFPVSHVHFPSIQSTLVLGMEWKAFLISGYPVKTILHWYSVEYRIPNSGLVCAKDYK